MFLFTTIMYLFAVFSHSLTFRGLLKDQNIPQIIPQIIKAHPPILITYYFLHLSDYECFLPRACWQRMLCSFVRSKQKHNRKKWEEQIFLALTAPSAHQVPPALSLSNSDVVPTSAPSVGNRSEAILNPEGVCCRERMSSH